MKRLLYILSILLCLASCKEDEVIISQHGTTYDTVRVNVRQNLYDTVRQLIYDTTRTKVYDTVHATVNDTVWNHQTITSYDTISITKYDTIKTKITDTIWSYQTITKYDTIKTKINDTIWSYQTITKYDTVKVAIYDTIRITVNPDGTPSNTVWIKYVIDPTTNKCDSVNVEKGQTIALKSDAERTGYDFLYWNTKPDGSGASYQEGGNYNAKAHTTFYGIWQGRDGLKSDELYDYLSKQKDGTIIDVKIIDHRPDFETIHSALQKFENVKVNLDLSDAICAWNIGFILSYSTNILTIKFPPNAKQLLHMYYSSGLTSMTDIPLSITSLSIVDFSSLKLVSIPNSITDLLIKDCPKITELTIPNSVQKLTLENLAGLETLTISNGITELTIKQCPKLRDLIIPNGVTELTLSQCPNLRDLIIPNGVTILNGLNGCSTLTEITIPSSIESMLMNFGNCSNLKTIRHSLKECSDIYFGGCACLTAVSIPEGISSIKTGTFKGCSNLTSLSMPETITSIGNYAFQNCSKLNSISIPKGVTSIGDDAFNGCSSLTSFTIPESVTYIGWNAFKNCSNLIILKLEGKNPPKIYNDLGCTNTLIYVPRSSIDTYKNDNIWKSYANRIVGY